MKLIKSLKETCINANIAREHLIIMHSNHIRKVVHLRILTKKLDKKQIKIKKYKIKKKIKIKIYKKIK